MGVVVRVIVVCDDETFATASRVERLILEYGDAAGGGGALGGDGKGSPAEAAIRSGSTEAFEYGDRVDAKEGGGCKKSSGIVGLESSVWILCDTRFPLLLLNRFASSDAMRALVLANSASCAAVTANRFISEKALSN